MQSPSTIKTPPVMTFTPEDTSEEVRRLETTEDNYLGAVVVGGRCTADMFIKKDADGNYDGDHR